MRWSKLFAPTLKEVPSTAESTSHKLLLRAGYIRPLGSGIYSLLPLAQKVRLRVIDLIRRHMQEIGAQEFHLSAIQPREIWQESDRLAGMGEIIFSFKDRRGADLVLGTTHEEIFTTIARDGLSSYRQLPQLWYQIQTKFRDELRPKGGLLRVREFTMKDSYSFDIDEDGMALSFDSHREAYCKIFHEAGLDYLAVEASNGSMGGSKSVEFMLLSDCGEDHVVVCNGCSYCANSEKACAQSEHLFGEDEKAFEKFPTPGVRTIVDLETFEGGAAADRQIKTLVYVVDDRLMLFLLRGDHDLNLAKLSDHLGATSVRAAEGEEIFQALGAHAGSLGAVGVTKKSHPQVKAVYADSSLTGACGMTTGANEDDHHLRHVTIARDMEVSGYFDFRQVKDGDKCAHCHGTLAVKKGLEIGHIFQLGNRYSEKMGAYVLSENGERKPIFMGSYGIGVERLIAAVVEASHDEKGIIFPVSIAPYPVVITATNMQDDDIASFSEGLYERLTQHGVEVLFDDREGSPGVKFAESELIGIPLRVTVGKKLKDGKVELMVRKGRVIREVDCDKALDEVLAFLAGEAEALLERRVKVVQV